MSILLVLVMLGLSLSVSVSGASLKRHRRRLGAFALVLAALGAMGAMAITHTARAEFAAWFLGGSASFDPLAYEPVPRALSDQLLGALMTSVCLAVVLPIAIAVFAWGLPQARDRFVTWAAALVVHVAGGIGLVFTYDVIAGIWEVSHSFDDGTGYLLVLQEAHARISYLRHAVWLPVALMPLAALASSRGEPRLSWGATAAAGLAVLAAAALALSTRTMAHDADNPLSAGRASRPIPTCGLRGADLPLSTTSFEFGPYLASCGLTPTLDGAPLGSVARFARDLETIERNWRVLHPREPWGGGRLHLAIAPSAEVERMRPYVVRAREMGWTVDLIAESTDAVPTATLGPVELTDLRVYRMPDELDAHSGRALLEAAARSE